MVDANIGMLGRAASEHLLALVERKKTARASAD